MKKGFIFLFVLSLCSINVQAEVINLLDKANGPVKKITIIRTEPAGIQRFQYYWFDTLGRITKMELYCYGKIQQAYQRQYPVDGVYMQYDYDENGLIKGKFSRTELDSLGNPIQLKRFRDGKCTFRDSTVYNELGLEVEHYYTNDDSLHLVYTCEYDEQGKLIKKQYTKDNVATSGKITTYMYKYKTNGNYIRTRYVNNKKTKKEKYIFSKTGQLLRVKGRDDDEKFSKFDQYNNWTLCTDKFNLMNAPMVGIYERVIEYYED